MADRRSRLSDHQAYALADQIYAHLGVSPARQEGKTAFGHQVANLVDDLQTHIPGRPAIEGEG